MISKILQCLINTQGQYCFVNKKLAATKEDLRTSPAEMVFGDSPLLPGEFASSGKTPFFPSFTQTSTTTAQHHRVDIVYL